MTRASIGCFSPCPYLSTHVRTGKNQMRSTLSSAALDQIFRTARTYNGWSDTAVDEGVVRDLYDLLKWGPTSANSCPARFVWVRSPEGKAQLAALAAGNNAPKHPDA